MISDSVGIVQFNMDGTIIDCNDNFLQIMGSVRENTIGFNLLTSVDNDEMWLVILSALSGTPGYYTGIYTSKTGSKCSKVKATYARIKSESGEVIGGLGIFEELMDQTIDE
jgi:two-component system, OmpR family, phosphate regulon sensor histidine kinase PhoR